MTSRESVVSATAVLLTNDQHSKESANQVRDSLNLVRDSLNQVRDSVNQVKDSVHPIKDPPNQGSDSSVVTDTKSREVTIRFRWYVTLPTTASQILFNCPFSVVPIAMVPKKLNGSDVYESSDMTVPCGTYNTCTLTVDSKKHVLEVVEIKHYSFEVDLYIDENDEDEEATVPVNTSYNTISKQLTPIEPSKNQSCDVVPVAADANRDESDMDDVIEDDSQSGQTSSRSLQRLNALESLLRQQIANRGPAVEEPVHSKSLGSSREALSVPDRRKFDGTINGFTVDDKVRDQLENRSAVEKTMKTNARIADSEAPDRRFEPIRTPISITSSGRPDCDWMGAGDDVVQDSMSSSFVSEPELRQFASAVRKSEQAKGGGMTIQDVSGFGRRNLEPVKELSVRSRSVDTLIGRKSLNDVNVASSRQHRELDLAGSTSSDYGNLHQTQPFSQGALERRASPSLGSREKIAAEVRAELARQSHPYSSEFHEKIGSSEMVSPSRNELDPGRLSSPKTTSSASTPVLRTALVTSRTTPISSGPPRIGAPHHAPLVAGPKDTLLHREEFSRQQDLEDTVRSLKDLIKERDGQIEELRKENSQLQSLLTEAKQSSLEDGDKRVRELIRDKENLATQLWKVKQDLERFTSEANKKPSESADNPQNNGLDNYSSNNPYALQRKLDDLHGHLQDLQEANETASTKLEQAEKMIASLRNENNVLQTSNENSLEDLVKQNSLLKEQIHRLQSGHWTDNSGPMHEEIQALREDLRILRDKNHLLVQDNIKLTEYIKDLQQLNGCTLPRRREDGGHVDLTRSDCIHLSSWKPKSQEEQENYGASGQRLRNETRSVSPMRNNPPPTDGALCSPTRLLRSNSPFLSNTRDRWVDIDSTTDLVHRPPDSNNSSFVGDYSRPRRDSLRSDITLTSVSHVDAPSDYERSDRHSKGLENDLLHFSPYDSANRNRKWPAQKHNGNVNNVATIGSAAPLLKQTSVFNTSSHTIEHVPPAVAPSIPWTRSNRSDIKPLTDSFANRSLDLNVKKTSMVVSRKPDIKRLSVCSNSTENILLEADMMLSASRDSLKQKPLSNSAYKSDVSSSVPQLIDQKPKGVKILESLSSTGTFLKEPTFSACSKRPFAPRSPSDLSHGDVVKFSRNGGHISKGQVKFIGHLPGKSDTYLGVELDNEMGKHDGVFEGTRYFQCKPCKGVFVAFCKVVMAWCD